MKKIIMLLVLLSSFWTLKAQPPLRYLHLNIDSGAYVGTTYGYAPGWTTNGCNANIVLDTNTGLHTTSVRARFPAQGNYPVISFRVTRYGFNSPWFPSINCPLYCQVYFEMTMHYSTGALWYGNTFNLPSVEGVGEFSAFPTAGTYQQPTQTSGEFWSYLVNSLDTTDVIHIHGDAYDVLIQP